MARLRRAVRRWRRRWPFWREETFAVAIILGLLAAPFVVCGFADFRLFLAVTGTCFVSLLLTIAIVAGATVLATRFETQTSSPPTGRINEQGEIVRDKAPAVSEKW
jgi:hypothetical protein